MISFPLPGLPRILNQVALQLASLDIIPTELVYEYMNIKFDEFSDHAFNSYFDQAGLSSM